MEYAEVEVESKRIVSDRLIKAVKKLGLPQDRCFVFATGIMDVLGLKESNDIDLVVAPEVFEKIREDKNWTSHYKEENGMVMYTTVVDGVEIETSDAHDWIDWYDEKTGFQGLIDRTEVFDDVRFINLDDLLAWKKNTNREKDFRTSRRWRSFLQDSVPFPGTLVS